MTVISKELFEKSIDNSVGCDVLHYWDRRCWQAHFRPYWWLNLCKGSATFFLPIYLFKLMLNYRRIKNKKFLWSLLISECRSSAYGVCMGILIVASACILRAATGKMHYYGLLFLPGFISGISLLLESKDNQVLDTIIFVNSFIETVLLKLNVTVFWETIAFMTASGLLMYMLENRDDDFKFMYIWFYTPPSIKNRNTKSDSPCNHDETCPIFFRQGFVKYFAVGYMINIVRQLLPKMGILLTKPQMLLKILTNKSNFISGLFVGNYVGLYRIITCLLKRSKQIKPNFHSLIGGVISGLAYLISPNIQVLVVTITTLLQICCYNISTVLKITNTFWHRQFLFMFVHGYLLHNKFFYPNTCSNYYKKMIDASTNNVSRKIYQRIVDKYIPDLSNSQ